MEIEPVLATAGAVRLIFGILVSTALTLVVIPVIYYAYQYRGLEPAGGSGG